MRSKRLWRRTEHYVKVARAQEESVKLVGIDETRVKRGHEYVTKANDLEARRLLFMTEKRNHDVQSI